MLIAGSSPFRWCRMASHMTRWQCQVSSVSAMRCPFSATNKPNLSSPFGLGDAADIIHARVHLRTAVFPSQVTMGSEEDGCNIQISTKYWSFQCPGSRVGEEERLRATYGGDLKVQNAGNDCQNCNGRTPKLGEVCLGFIWESFEIFCSIRSLDLNSADNMETRPASRRSKWATAVMV